MPKKKTPVNGFALFMKDHKRNQEAKGIYFNNMTEVSDDAGRIWRNMTCDEKAIYNARAKQIKGEDKNDLSKKFTSLGVSYQEIENERLRKEEEENIMTTYVKTMLNSLNVAEGFRKKVFYLIHVNYFYKNNHHVFKPAELGMAQFNLSRGIIKRFHRFIDPGNIEIGFRSEAKTMMEYHGIPIEDPKWTLGENDYRRLFYQILKFMEEGIEEKGRLPPLYTMPNNVNQNTCRDAVVSVLNTLCDAVGDDPDIFRIYPLPYLFHEMRQKAIRESEFCRMIDYKLISLPMASRDIEKDPFQYCKGSSCDFHDEKDLGHVCSLSVASRWVYTICDHMLGYIPDNVIPNGHVPLDCESALKSERVAQALASGKFHTYAVTLKTDYGYNEEDEEEEKFDTSALLPAVQPTIAPPDSRKLPEITTPSAWTAGKLGNVSNRTDSEEKSFPIPQPSSGAIPKVRPPGWVPPRNGYASAVSSAPKPPPAQPKRSDSPDLPNDTFWPPIGRGAGRGINNTSMNNNWALGGGRGAMLRRQFSQS